MQENETDSCLQGVSVVPMLIICKALTEVSFADKIGFLMGFVCSFLTTMLFMTCPPVLSYIRSARETSLVKHNAAM